MAAALAASEKFYDCRECREKGLDKMRNCQEDAPFPVYEIDEQEFFRCPVQFITDESIEALTMHHHYKDGFLPYSGGVMDQPAKILEQMRIIDSAYYEVRKEMRGK